MGSSNKNVRFSFIEAVLVEHNELQRKYICNAFSVTEPTATRLIRAYKNKYPNNLIFDVACRCYRASQNFRCENLDNNIAASEFLKAAQIMAEKAIFE